MMHGTYLPDGLLEQFGEVKVVYMTLVTKDAKLTPLGISAYWAILGALVFTLVYKLSRHYTPLFFKGYSRMSTHDQRDWDTRPGNIIYSIYIVYCAARFVMLDDFFWRADSGVPMILRISPDTSAALGVSIGFFFMEMVITLKYWMGGTAMVVHHLGSLSCVVTAAISGHGHCMTLWMLSTELTTPFIAFRYLLDKAGYKTHPVYVVNGMSILVTWTVARLATFVPFYFVVWNIRGELKHLNYLTTFLLLVFPAILAILNIFWYTKIVKGAIKALRPHQNTQKLPAKTD